MAIAECKINEGVSFAQRLLRDGNTSMAKVVAELCYEVAKYQINHPVEEIATGDFLLEKTKKCAIEAGVVLWEGSWAAENEARIVARKKKAPA